MGFYENLRDKTATPLIKKYGVAIVLTRTVSPTRDAVTGEITASVPTLYNGYAIVEEYADSLINGSTIKQGDKRLLCVGVPNPSEPNDTISIAGTLHNVVNSKPISPGNVDVAYEVQVRN